MITTAIFYGIKCDRCGEQYEDCDDHTHWPNEESAIEFAINYDKEGGWIERDGKHYCPGCYTVNEETDEEFLLPPIPINVKHIRQFIQKIIGCGHSMIETPESYVLSFWVSSSHSLNGCDENYIRSYLADRLIGITYQGNTQPSINSKCLIEIKK